MPVEKSSSKAKENRRSNKPLMEKRRRARINKSLSELKNLILDAMKKDPSRTSKLEKADILEMAVRHLQSLHKSPQPPDPKVANKYRAGYNECTREVTRFLATASGVDVTTRTDLLGHLANRLNLVASDLSAAAATPADSTSPASPTPAAPSGGASKAPPIRVPVSTVIPITLGSVKYGNSSQCSKATPTGTSGFQLIPTRLPNGDLALVLPNDNLSSLLNTLSVATASAVAETAMAARGVAKSKDGEGERPTSSNDIQDGDAASAVPESNIVWRPW